MVGKDLPTLVVEEVLGEPVETRPLLIFLADEVPMLEDLVCPKGNYTFVPLFMLEMGEQLVDGVARGLAVLGGSDKGQCVSNTPAMHHTTRCKWVSPDPPDDRLDSQTIVWTPRRSSGLSQTMIPAHTWRAPHS